jgi:hypothetical protein
MSIDSEAVFEKRACELGMSKDELQSIRAKSWNTMGKFAFSCGYAPGGLDDVQLRKLASIVTDSGANDPPDDRLPIICRLYFESYTMVSSDLRSRVERLDDDTPRRLPNPERAVRHKQQATRLSGIELTGENECSHALIDVVGKIFDDDQVTYVQWSACTKRMQELTGQKSIPYFKADANGSLKQVSFPEELQADTSTDLLLKQCLQRRSLAFDQWRLADYLKFEKWTKVLIEAYIRSPPQGFRRVSVEQMHRADVELFAFIQEETRNGVRPAADGTLPFEVALEKAMQSHLVLQHLQPLQNPGGASSGLKRRVEDSTDAKGADTKQHRQVEQLKNEIRNLKSGNSGPERKTKGGKGGKGGGKTGKGTGSAREGSGPRMPLELIGMSPTTADGSPICFNFNLDGCSKATPGNRCPRGFHVCCRPGCGKKEHGSKGHDAS